jgi:hypothetical protein
VPAYATDSDLTTRIPATLDATEGQRTLALSDAQAEISLTRYGEASTRAHALVAAHYLTLSGAISGGESGVVTSMSAGEISAAFGSNTSNVDPMFGSTVYGRQFLQLRDSLASYPRVG